MAKETQTSRVEILDTMSGDSGRNLRGFDIGVSSATARREIFCPGTECMMEAVVERENMISAYKRVMRNRGSAGVDGMTVTELKFYLQTDWA